MAKDKLTDKQEMFCREYVIDFNATRAAIAAGYSKNTAKSQGQRMLTNVDLQNFIKQLTHEKIERTKYTQDDALEIVTNVAFADYTEVVTIETTEVQIDYDEEKGEPVYSEIQSVVVKDMKDVPLHLRRCITGMKQGKNGIEITFMSKDSASEKLMKHFGLYEKDNEQKDGGLNSLMSLPLDKRLEILKIMKSVEKG